MCNSHLDPCMAAQVEIKLGRMSDGTVHCGTSWDVATFSNLKKK